MKNTKVMFKVTLKFYFREKNHCVHTFQRQGFKDTLLEGICNLCFFLFYQRLIFPCVRDPQFKF